MCSLAEFNFLFQVLLSRIYATCRSAHLCIARWVTAKLHVCPSCMQSSATSSRRYARMWYRCTVTAVERYDLSAQEFLDAPLASSRVILAVSSEMLLSEREAAVLRNDTRGRYVVLLHLVRSSCAAQGLWWVGHELQLHAAHLHHSACTILVQTKLLSLSKIANLVSDLNHATSCLNTLLLPARLQHMGRL